jgi:hypothetical protein
MDSKVRGIISILVVGVFLILVLAYVLGSKGSHNEIADLKFDKFISAFSGLIGVIIGYYFKGASDMIKKP